MRPALLAILVGCGRVNFDPLAGNGGDGRPPGEASMLAAPCPIGMTAPDPITISGVAFRATTGIHQAGVVVSAMRTVTGSPVAMMTTNLTGDFSLSVPTGGMPIAPYFSLTKAGFLTSISVPDQPVDANVSSIAGFMGMQIDVDGLYNAGGVTQDLAAGTLFVTVEDCAGAEIQGATIAVTPAAPIVYSSGILPSGSATSTGTSGYAWVLNAPVGTIQLTAAAPGRVFLPHPVDILAGSNAFMGTVIRPTP